MWEGAPHWLNNFITCDHFEEISHALRVTDRPTPPFNDGFFIMQQLQEEFNLHYKQNYFPLWLSCLDELMSPWFKIYAPGYMFVPQMPHPFGNKFHTITDGDQGKPIMWQAKIQEENDRPMNGSRPFYPLQFETFLITVKLMLEMSELIHGSGRVVVHDSSFCMTAGILALHNIGVF